MMRSLLAAGNVDVNLKDHAGGRALAFAIEGGVPSIVRLMLSLDCIELDYLNSDGGGPLAHAIQEDSLEIVKLLIATGKLELEAHDLRYGTPLVAAAVYDRPEIVAFLSSMGSIDLNASSTRHTTALCEAASNGSLDSIFALLQAGADPDFGPMRSGKEGETPLMRAIRARESEVVRVLLDTGRVNVNYRIPTTNDSPGADTPLTIAVQEGEVGIVKLLLAVDSIDVNVKDNEGKAPLSLAIYSSDAEELVRLLLETRKAEVNTQDVNGRTPFTCILQKKETLTREYAQEENPSPIRTRIYEEALKSCDNIINILKEHGARAPSQRSIDLFRAAVALHRRLCLRNCEQCENDLESRTID
ncbi:ankyrin repeat-containing domain protein [Amylocarpus encephaloides]|uniref:protein S-acyltransferase n=1 Tax=Amylocarpus encephaloides TaxID=45428 RepID=A0A9P8C431_9HELO|nr:ankyrin repeat-containing domain protein [Amylocarpus encephaloides]